MATKTRRARRRTKIIFVILSVLSVSVVKTSAQNTFQKIYGDSTVNDIGQSILQTSDGGFLIAGTRFDSGNQIESLFLIRTDQNGDTLWTKLVKEPAVNYSGSQVIQTVDGGFAITGIKGGGVTFVPYLLKIDSAGNMLANKSYLWFADEHISSIVQTPDSGFLLAGYLYNGNNLVYFIRTNADGDTLWTKSYGENFYNASVYSVHIAKDGGFIAAGSIQNTSSQDVDAFLFKTDSLGNVEWAKGYGDAGYDYAQQVEVTSDSGFILAAVTYSFGAGLADFYLVKTDSSGNLAWSKTYGGGSDDRSESVRQTPDGGYLFTGESASFSFGNFDVYMIRTDANGDTVWTKTVNGLENNEGYSLALTTDSGFAITGNYFSHFSNNDVFLLKSDIGGSMGCSERSSATIVTNPATQTLNHHLVFSPSQPSVISHTMETSSGAGIETLCSPVGIKDVIENNSFLVYPNPAGDKLTIESKQNTIISIRVFNTLGTAVFLHTVYCITFGKPTATEGPLPAQLDLFQLIPGIYILEITTSNRTFYTKFLKQ